MLSDWMNVRHAWYCIRITCMGMVHIAKHTYKHTYVHACIHSNIHTHAHTHTYCIHTHTYIHTAHIHTYMHADVHRCIDKWPHAYMHPYIHTHIDIKAFKTNENFLKMLIDIKDAYWLWIISLAIWFFCVQMLLRALWMSWSSQAFSKWVHSWLLHLRYTSKQQDDMIGLSFNYYHWMNASHSRLLPFNYLTMSHCCSNTIFSFDKNSFSDHVN